MSAVRLPELLACLPLHAEEGPIKERVPETVLVDAAGESTVSLVRRLFCAMALLDEQDLMAHRWSFVSFPAALTARSVLATLADPQGIFLPRDYWQQGTHRPQHISEEQRALLQRLELERAKTGKPIRFVTVAWGIIRAGNRFLLCPREDIRRRNAGHYVLPGGRVNLNDMPAELRAPEVLARMNCGDQALLEQMLPLTLSRELHEELGLTAGEDYQAHWMQMLPPYEKCEGAGNHFAFSRYRIALYSVSLTRCGLLKLLDLETHAGLSKMAWFSRDELRAGRRHDGATCFVDALFADGSPFASDDMATIPEAFSEAGTTIEGIEWSVAPNQFGSLGATGREKPLAFQLSPQAWALGLLLMWHRRGFAVELTDSAIVRLGFGWLKLASEPMLAIAHELVASCSKIAPGLFEIEEDQYVRCVAAPEALWFAPSWFSQELVGKDPTTSVLTIKLTPPPLPWGRLLPITEEVTLRRNTLRIVTALMAGQDPRDVPGIVPGDLKSKFKQKFDPITRALGLRKYVRGLGNDDTGIPKLTISPPKRP